MVAPARQRQDRIKSRRERRKQARKARVRRQAVRYVLLVILLIVGSLGIFKVHWSPLDARYDVVVRGNHIVRDEQVKSALRSAMRKPLYILDPRKLESQVEDLEACHKAFVRRYLLPRPHILVQVLEEVPFASFSLSPEEPVSAVIAESGRKIPVNEFPSVYRPPLLICGSPEMKLNAEQVSKWGAWVNYISQLSDQNVVCIDLRNPSNVLVKAGDYNIKLGAVDSSLTRRIARLSSIMTTLQSVSSRLDVIDLSLDSNVPLVVSKTEHKAGDAKAQEVDKEKEAQVESDNGGASGVAASGN